MIIAGDDGEIVSDGGRDIMVDEQPAYRVRTQLTDEETAHDIRERMVEAGIDGDKIQIVEEFVEVDGR